MKIAFPKDLENNEIKNELNQNKKVELIITGSYLKYEANKHSFDFQKF